MFRIVRDLRIAKFNSQILKCGQHIRPRQQWQRCESTKRLASDRYGHHQNHFQVLSYIRNQLKDSQHLAQWSVIDALRLAYPNHVLVQTSFTTGILDLVKPDGLEAVIDKDIEHYAVRSEDHSQNEDDGQKCLKDEIEFGRYNCCWKGRDFYMYSVNFNAFENEYSDHFNYVLCPVSSVHDEVDQRKFIDGLILAALEANNVVEKEIWVYENSSWYRSEKLWKSIENSVWDDVILDPTLKLDLINDILQFFDRKELYAAFGVPWKRGLILHGLPGNGKTLTIKAMIRSLDQRLDSIPTLYVKALSGGARSEDIDCIFEKAREVAPCLLVCEDLDALVTRNVRSHFLNELDGLEQNNGILIVGSTNHLDNLDVAVSKRPSRFDRKYHFPLPALAERIRYCEHWRNKLSRNSQIQLHPDLLKRLAKITEGLSFAYIQEVFVSALMTLVTEAKTTCAKTTNHETDTNNLNVIPSEKVWLALQKQVDKIRKELSDSKRSIEDANRNTAMGDAKSDSGKSVGFGA